MKYLFIGLSFLIIGCGNDLAKINYSVPTYGNREDGSVVRGVAVYTVTSQKEYSLWKFLGFSAYAASTATVTVTYNNAPSVTFTINATNFVAGVFTGDILSLGSFTITALKDNHLKVCNPGGNTKCTSAFLRVYSTGSIAGFVNTTDSYGLPIYTSGDNPATPLVLNSPGTNLDSLTGMATTKHTVRLSDFTPTTFNVTSDFTNGGDGPYQVVYVVEYALAP